MEISTKNINVVSNKQPLVSVRVITYNSAKFVLETLDSIKAQTYPNIELIISDDCSTDDTVEKCKQWLCDNSNRFVRVNLIESPTNTGTAANVNRADAVCHGEWVKGIAGDDLMLPNAITEYIDYTANNHDVVLLFGRCKAFGADQSTCDRMESMFNYDFFNWKKEQKLHQLVYRNNCIPATTLFYNRHKVMELGIANDEKVPLLEDWCKWISVVQKDIPMHFMDRIVVMYRWGGICTRGHWSVDYYKSHRLLFFNYQYPVMIQENETNAIETIIEHESNIYADYLNSVHSYESVVNSHAYKIGIQIMKPIKFVKRTINKILLNNKKQ